MKKLILLFTLALAGCSTPVPITPKFPEAPKELTLQCSKLKVTPEKTELSELTKVVISNYAEYHLCSNRVDGWNEWYTEQKKIFEALK